MNTGQTLITLSALMFLTISVLDLNGFIADNDISLTQNQYRMEALSMATSYIEQASAQYFDEIATDISVDKDLSDFTAPGDLGFDTGDNSNIDDFDDYHTLTVHDTGSSGVPYQLYFEVDYVELSGSTLSTSASRQYHKRMKVSIKDDYPQPLIYKWVDNTKVREALTISFIKSYWFYN